MLPRVGHHVGRELIEEFAAALGGEAGRHPAVMQAAGVVVQSHHQRAHAIAVDVHPVAGHGHIDRAGVLDLELRPLVGQVDAVAGLGDQPVEPGALEALVPALGQLPVEGRGSQMHRRLEGRRHRLQHGTPVAERFGRQIGVSHRQHVEGHELGRGLRGQPGDPALGGVDPLLQGVEAELVVDAHDDLAVDHRPSRQSGFERLDQLGEVASQGLLVAAAEHHFVAVAEDDAAEAVPLRLEGQVAVGNAVNSPGQHRLHRRHHGQVHAAEPTCRAHPVSQAASTDRTASNPHRIDRLASHAVERRAQVGYPHG